MKCVNSTLVFEYLNGSMDKETSENIEKHILSCKVCSNTKNAVESLKQAASVTPPAELTSNIMSKIENFTQPAMSNSKSDFLRFLFHPVTAPGIVIFLIVVVLAVFAHQNNGLSNISFNINLENAKSVALVGDFNNWDHDTGLLVKNGKVWSGTFKIKPGRYQYMLVIDGNQWVPDPAAKEYVDDGYGNRNSLLDIAKAKRNISI